MLKSAVLLLIRTYQRILSPDQGIFAQGLPRCRFAPSCSEYLYQAVQKNGVIKGSWQGLKRISKCHPWHKGGQDPLP